MKQNVIILLFMMTGFGLHAKTLNGGKVDPLIENEFKKEFGPSLRVSWEIVEDISIATFIEKGEERHVYYFSDGQVLGFGKTIDKTLLPETISRSISKKFTSGVIENVYEFKTADSPTRYFVRIATPTYSVVASANEFGNLDIKLKERSR